jgi:hypothetical protein
VHYKHDGECCYTIICEEDSVDSPLGGSFTVPAESARSCNRTLCPALPSVCPKEGTCLVKAVCDPGGANCSCKVELKCFDNKKHAYEIEYQFEENPTEVKTESENPTEGKTESEPYEDEDYTDGYDENVTTVDTEKEPFSLSKSKKEETDTSQISNKTQSGPEQQQHKIIDEKGAPDNSSNRGSASKSKNFAELSEKLKDGGTGGISIPAADIGTKCSDHMCGNITGACENKVGTCWAQGRCTAREDKQEDCECLFNVHCSKSVGGHKTASEAFQRYRKASDQSLSKKEVQDALESQGKTEVKASADENCFESYCRDADFECKGQGKVTCNATRSCMLKNCLCEIVVPPCLPTQSTPSTKGYSDERLEEKSERFGGDLPDKQEEEEYEDMPHSNSTAGPPGSGQPIEKMEPNGDNLPGEQKEEEEDMPQSTTTAGPPGSGQSHKKSDPYGDDLLGEQGEEEEKGEDMPQSNSTAGPPESGQPIKETEPNEDNLPGKQEEEEEDMLQSISTADPLLSGQSHKKSDPYGDDLLGEQGEEEEKGEDMPQSNSTVGPARNGQPIKKTEPNEDNLPGEQKEEEEDMPQSTTTAGPPGSGQSHKKSNPYGDDLLGEQGEEEEEEGEDMPQSNSTAGPPGSGQPIKKTEPYGDNLPGEQKEEEGDMPHSNTTAGPPGSGQSHKMSKPHGGDQPDKQEEEEEENMLPITATAGPPGSGQPIKKTEPYGDNLPGEQGENQQEEEEDMTQITSTAGPPGIGQSLKKFTKAIQCKVPSRNHAVISFNCGA